jgi:hypothetical protein
MLNEHDKKERILWPTVIRLDLVCSVNKILDALGDAPEHS